MKVFGLLISAVFLVQVSASLLRPLRSGKPPQDLLLFLLIFTAIQSFMILLAGVLGLLSFWPLTLGAAIGSLACWALDRRPDLSFLRDLRPQTPSGKALATGMAVGFAALIVKAIAFSPYFQDAVLYHLVTVAEWTRAHRFVDIATIEPRIWLPNGFQLVELWWVVFLHHDVFIELAGVQMLAVVLAALACLARTLGYPRSFPTFAFAFLPLVILHATSCGNDLAAGAMVLSAFALIADRAPRLLQAVPLILGAGIKPTVLMAASGVVFFALIAPKPERRPLPRAAWGLLGLALALGVFWYGRNTVLTGHPWRAMFGNTPERPFMTAVDRISFDALMTTLFQFPFSLRDGRVYETLAGDSTSWGWFVLPVAIPLTIVSLHADPAFRRLFLAFTIGWLTVLACVEDFAYPLRYALWFPAIFVLGASREVGRPVLVAAVLAAALNFVATVVPEETRRIREAHRVPPSVPRDAPLAVIYEVVGFTYPLYNADFSRQLFFPRSMEDLKRSGVKYAFMNDLPEWARPALSGWKRVGGRVYEIR